MTRRRSERGFTLVELAFAGMIAAGLTLVGLELLARSVEVRTEVDAAYRINRAARQTLATMADGARGAGGGSDGTGIAHGARSRAGPPTIVLQDGEVMDIQSNGLTVTGDRTSPITIVCAGAADPLPACAAANETIQLDGALAGQPVFVDDQRSVYNRTVELEIQLRDPYAAARGDGRVERFGGIHIYNAVDGEGTPNVAGGQIGG